ncbi:MAG: translation initiation factor IF-2 [Patescibacteria group bacterium]
MQKIQKQKNTGLVARPPIVVVMGHIDHGKSTLLDFIRKSNVAEKEAGGITQKMSAYEVKIPSAKSSAVKITFLDTPGHEAFKAIRSRGAKVADIAILVVAADDGVKPQTLEALKCIQEEKMPYIVAINKIDKPGANLEKTRNSLSEHGIFLEGYGGDVPGVEISAKLGKNIPELLELISLVAELEELKGDKETLAEGFVLESHLDPKCGISVSLLIKNGSLRTGLFVTADKAYTPVRMMENFLGEKIDEASFSSPIKIIGWNEIPKVGSSFKTFETRKEAESAVINFKEPTIVKKQKANTVVNSDMLTIPIMLKADTEGSLEAIKHEITKLNTGKIEFKIINSSIGQIGEGDIKNANLEKKPIIIAFNTKIDNSAKSLALREEVTIKIFDVIYKITEWLKTDLATLLPKIDVEEITGKAVIIKVFGMQKEKQIIGGKVIEGLIETGGLFRINRRGNIIGTGKIRGLQQKKAETKEVSSGNEFGALVEGKITVTAADTLEFFKVTKQPVKI